MKIIQPIIDWTQRVFGEFGALGLFALAFIEASFFPVPCEALLIPLCLANPDNFLLYATVCTVGSVLGAMFGYYIGLFGKKTILEKMFSKNRIHKVHKMFDKHGSLAVFIGGFTPVPYKIFTISAGVFYINFRNFVTVSLVSRGLRFFAIAFLIYLYGDMILSFMNNYFDLTTLLIVVILILIYVFYLRMKLKNKNKYVFI
jgi:membrane protein YqaA with SNARE-associated domain